MTELSSVGFSLAASTTVASDVAPSLQKKKRWRMLQRKKKSKRKLFWENSFQNTFYMFWKIYSLKYVF